MSNLKSEIEIPKMPFYGFKHEECDVEEIFKYLNKQTLFALRWGYKNKGIDKKEYDDIMRRTVLPEFEAMKAKVISEGIAHPKVAYGFYGCYRDGDHLVILNEDGSDRLATFKFPRQKNGNRLCIADYFADRDDADDVWDVVGMQVVSLGATPIQFCADLYSENKYKEYYMYHLLFAELTEAFAEFQHARMRDLLNINTHETKKMDTILNGKYQGKRYSFGYSSCPNLGDNAILLKLLNGDGIGVVLNDGLEMEPEYTTSAVVIHNACAEHFVL